MRRVILALVLPAAVALVAFLLADPAGDARNAAGLRLGAFLILGGGAMVPFLGVTRSGGMVLELVALGTGGGAAYLIGTISGLERTLALPAAATVAGAWLLAWSLALLPRLLGFGTVGRLCWIAALAAMLGTPYLVRSATSTLPPALSGARTGELPEWVTVWNPLARLHGSILGQDWFHGALLYPRVGERYYRYPDWHAALGGPAMVAGGLLGLGVLLAASRRLRGGTRPCAWARRPGEQGAGKEAARSLSSGPGASVRTEGRPDSCLGDDAHEEKAVPHFPPENPG